MRINGASVICLVVMGICVGFAGSMILTSSGVDQMNPVVIAVFGMVFIGTVAFWLGSASK